MADGPGKDPAGPVGNGEPEIGVRAPVLKSMLKAEIPPAESFRLLTYRNLPWGPRWHGLDRMVAGGKGGAGNGLSFPLAESNVNPATVPALRSVAYR